MGTMRWKVGLAALMVVSVVAGCAERSEGPPSSERAASASTPTPSAVVSSAVPVDPGYEACAKVQAIKDKGYRTTFGDVARAGDLGRESPNSDVRAKAMLMGDFADAAAVSVQTGGDPREKGAEVRGLLDDLIATCLDNGYLPAPKRS